ncbi:MAG: hypothetical protein KDE33_25390, partial [Bacteroidetes bacterium]|nr:hypothetical protein [Bacteroidota bacterium]
GDDKDASSEGRQVRNLSFVGNNIELSAVGVVQLFEEKGRYYQRPLVNVNVFAGLALLYFNPKAEIPATDHNGNAFADAGKMTSLRQYQTEQVKYGPVTLAIPFGLGVKMKISPFFNIGVNGGYRYTLTDYMDDISTVYPGTATFTDPLAQALSDRRPEIGLPTVPAGSRRGNPNNKDGYVLVNLHVEYYLPSDLLNGNKSRRGPKRSKYKYKQGKRR